MVCGGMALASALGIVSAFATISPVQAQAQAYTVLGNFGNNGTGVNPLYVTLDGAANVYGTTYYGGTSYLGFGVVFKLTHRGSNWLQSVLYDFSGGNEGGKSLRRSHLRPGWRFVRYHLGRRPVRRGSRL